MALLGWGGLTATVPSTPLAVELTIHLPIKRIDLNGDGLKLLRRDDTAVHQHSQHAGHHQTQFGDVGQKLHALLGCDIEVGRGSSAGEVHAAGVVG